MSTYGDLSKPQRAILQELLQECAVSIETALTSRSTRRLAPFFRLRQLGLISYQASAWSYVGISAWLTADGLRLVQSVRANAATSRYRRFRDASHNYKSLDFRDASR
ncbi:hypothetical protein VDG09_13775 [Xanthomonas campestris pv. raphani]|uniref:hypothetical protein n=1 Tax=Xanthomonas campestris TaxID=339 RepID=UPI002B225888|nr:hypothetical protein [Xanthomonas campestris]MEA9828711.1 hypothetical protein [Xanthomonas campestris pv. raphani]